MTTWASPTAGLISQQGTPVPPNRLHTSPPNPPQIDLPNCWHLSELAECWCGGPGHGGPGRAPPDPAQAGEHYATGKVILRTVSLRISRTSGALVATASTSTHSGTASVSLAPWRPSTTQRRWGTNLAASCLSNFLELLDITEAMNSVDFWLNRSSTLLYFFCILKDFFLFAIDWNKVTLCRIIVFLRGRCVQLLTCCYCSQISWICMQLVVKYMINCASNTCQYN